MQNEAPESPDFNYPRFYLDDRDRLRVGDTCYSFWGVTEDGCYLFRTDERPSLKRLFRHEELRDLFLSGEAEIDSCYWSGVIH